MRQIALLLLLVLVSLALPVVALVLVVKADLWPKGWNSQQQAVLAAALVGGFAPLYAAGTKALYDEVAARQGHDRQIRKLLFDGYEEYSRSLLYPLLAASGDLHGVLRWSLDNSTQEMKREVLYNVCRYTECVSQLRIRFTRAGQPPQRGLFLASPRIEDLVWRLVVEPWALGVPGAVGSAIANMAVRDTYGRAVPTTEFLRDIPDEDKGYLSDSVFQTLADDEVRTLLSDTLFALNAVLDWAIMEVLKPWYGRLAPFPHKVLHSLNSAPPDLRLKIGLQLPKSYRQ
jgi:hypothetical protein